jgi:hypothetical protein
MVQCSPDNSAVQVCANNAWQNQTSCNTAAGEMCSDAVCKGPCDLVPLGNVGCSFYPVNLWSTSTSGDFGIVATNTSSTLTSQVTLEDPNGNPIQDATDEQGNPITMPLPIPPGGVGIFHLAHAEYKLSQTELAQKGLHLSSTAPVAIYQFHPIDAANVFSGSATLLLPEQVLAKNYFVMSYTYNADLMTTPPQGQGLLAVVGLSDNTQVEVTVPVATMSGPGVSALTPHGTLKQTLNRLQVLEIAQANSLEDISGATVTSSAPVAVYGGAGAVSVPVSAIGGNHFGVQMFPLETWGKTYLASMLKQRNNSDRDYYRVVASVDNTHLTLTGSGLPMTVPTLNSGQFFEFSAQSDFQIEGDQPIMAFQYMPAWGSLSGTYDPTQFPYGVSSSCPFADSSDDVQCLGDANITPLVPVEQYRDDYIFYIPTTYEYQFVNVNAPIGTALTVDGTPVTEMLTPIANSGYGTLIVPKLVPGNHRITGDQPFGIIAYGYAYATSYSYAGGLNLAVINPIQ